MVGWAAVALDAWLKASGITSGPLFRRIVKNGKLGTAGLSGTAVRDLVKARCLLTGVGDAFSAHSLRSGFVTEAGRQNMPLQETLLNARLELHSRRMGRGSLTATLTGRCPTLRCTMNIASS